MKTGHYASVSEIIREALRNQIRSSMCKQLDDRIALARQQVKNDEGAVADDAYFDQARDYIKEKYLPDPD